MKLRKLIEEWETSFKTGERFQAPSGNILKHKAKVVEIFRNPSSKDFTEVAKGGEVRFLVSLPKKKVYIFEPNSFHHDAAFELGLAATQPEYLNNSNLLGGVAAKKDGKWITSDMHSFTFSKTKSKKETLKKNWKWADKYINVTDYLTKTGKKYGIKK